MEEHTSLGICVSQGGEHISLGIRVSQVGEHISLGIRVSQVGEHIFTRDMSFPDRGTHVTGDMFFPGGEHIPLGICVSRVGKTYHKGYMFPR